VQDPTRRPTAQGLLQHDFLQHVQAPASLQHTISAHAAKRPPLDQLNHQAAEYQQTMPRWNFGTEQAPPGAQPQAKKAGTLRSHQINMTFRDDGTVRHHTVAKHPSLAMMAQLAEAGLVSSKAASYSTMLLLGSFVALLLLPQHQQELRMLNTSDHVCWRCSFCSCSESWMCMNDMQVAWLNCMFLQAILGRPVFGTRQSLQ